MTKDTIIKFLNNKCTEAELEEIIRWAKTDAFNEESTRQAFNNWNSFREIESTDDDEKFNLLFDKIKQRINSDSEYSKKVNPRQVRIVTWLTRAAAILLFPVLAFLLYTITENAELKNESAQEEKLPVETLEIIAPVGSRTVVQLADGSEVHLNYGSRLKYPQIFSGEYREVELSGEGYFDVAHNPDKPFIVKAGTMNVKALGTAFNVLAYHDHDEIETTLVDGKVVLEKVDTGGEVKVIGSMVPGQHVNYNINTGLVSSSKGNIDKYIAWKDGKLVFDETSILKVAEKLSRMYNVEIEVADEIKDYTYTVTFEDEPLFQILDLMTYATPVRYKALPRKKLPSGSYEKQKIKLYKNK